LPNVYIIAGPNGAGKTTFARKFLPKYARCTNFINADLIAQGISPLLPEAAAIRAGRFVLSEIERYRKQKDDFAFETTLSGRSHIAALQTLKRSGYEIHIFYLSLPLASLALSRVKGRVLEGGHSVPEFDVRRRFDRSLSNFFRYYRSLADSWIFFDNSGKSPEAIALHREGTLTIIDDEAFRGFIARYGERP